MKIRALIRRLRVIEEKYGNVEVLTLQQGEFAPPKPSWLADGARWDLEGFANEFGKEKKIVL